MTKHVFLLILLSANVSFAQHQPNREHRPNKEEKPKASFSFWFNSKPMHNVVFFDKYFIFNFEEEVQTAVEKTRELQNQFRQEVKLINVQMDYLVKEMDILLEQQLNGVDNSQKIIDNYTKLHQLEIQHYDRLLHHTKEIQEIFHNSHREYNETISQKIEHSKNDPDVILVDLLGRYKILKQQK